MRSAFLIPGIFLVLASGCGRPTQDLGEFAPLVERFVAEARARGVEVDASDLIVRLGDTSQYGYGVCLTGTGKTPTVILHESLWIHATPLMQEALLFHELGHCLLGLDHTNGGLMSSGISFSAYERDRIGTLDALFRID